MAERQPPPRLQHHKWLSFFESVPDKGPRIPRFSLPTEY